ncbi:hypothetical protein J8273_3244 [Carpediemonas membranifera]|uniref:Uncharacterized protein n=1 Tax=Carpediemonas membranifera TaxID=201153 RepID=A0A8J6E9C0_9EUKA|nr:hypothetical protein J8273_3244 [Carpediemonas membranifera]|eukprot:KAG9393115.1 hypothetical protein J8273_3244 [Carpediemonas membranifera]
MMNARERRRLEREQQRERQRNDLQLQNSRGHSSFASPSPYSGSDMRSSPTRSAQFQGGDEDYAVFTEDPRVKYGMPPATGQFSYSPERQLTPQAPAAKPVPEYSPLPQPEDQEVRRAKILAQRRILEEQMAEKKRVQQEEKRLRLEEEAREERRIQRQIEEEAEQKRRDDAQRDRRRPMSPDTATEPVGAPSPLPQESRMAARPQSDFPSARGAHKDPPASTEIPRPARTHGARKYRLKGQRDDELETSESSDFVEHRPRRHRASGRGEGEGGNELMAMMMKTMMAMQQQEAKRQEAAQTEVIGKMLAQMSELQALLVDRERQRVESAPPNSQTPAVERRMRSPRSSPSPRPPQRTQAPPTPVEAPAPPRAPVARPGTSARLLRNAQHVLARAREKYGDRPAVEAVADSVAAYEAEFAAGASDEEAGFDLAMESDDDFTAIPGQASEDDSLGPSTIPTTPPRSGDDGDPGLETSDDFDEIGLVEQDEETSAEEADAGIVESEATAAEVTAIEPANPTEELVAEPETPPEVDEFPDDFEETGQLNFTIPSGMEPGQLDDFAGIDGEAEAEAMRRKAVERADALAAVDEALSGDNTAAAVEAYMTKKEQDVSMTAAAGKGGLLIEDGYEFLT